MNRLLESWPPAWDLADHRCRGRTVRGGQCTRRIRAGHSFCYAHATQTRENVLAAAPECGEEQVRNPSVDPYVHSHEEGKDTSFVGLGRGSNLRAVPEERRCGAAIVTSAGAERRCTGWTIAVDDGVYDAYCVAHSRSSRATRAREVAATVGAQALQRHNDYESAARKPIFNGELKTQDDVAAARMALLRKLEIGGVTATAAKAMDAMLKNVSTHIERFGTHQGAEGGAGVLRLLPGSKLIEMDTDLDYVMTKEDLEKIEAGLAEDEKAGVPTPQEFDEIIFRYLGVRTRRRELTRSQLKTRGASTRT